jgi:hypothetical protein
MKLLSMRIILAAGILAAGLSMAAPADAYTVKGMGKCTGWVGGTDDRFWILGFISGNNYATSGNAARDVDADEIYKFVTRYCKQNPGDDLADAMTAFLKVN